MKKQRSLDTELVDMIDNLYLLGRRMRMMENKPRRYGGDTPLFPNEVYTLKAIAQQAGINQTELSEQMFRTKGATSVVIRKLKKKGLIIQRDDEQDSRISRLYPTEKGMEIYRGHLAYDHKYIVELAGSLDVALEDLANMNRVLRSMNQRFLRRYQEQGTAAFDEVDAVLTGDTETE